MKSKQAKKERKEKVERKRKLKKGLIKETYYGVGKGFN